MMGELVSQVRRRIRCIRRREDHPLLLPHFRIEREGLVILEQRLEPLPESTLAALKLCEGTRTLGDVVRQSGVSGEELLRQHDQGRIILWQGRHVGWGLPHHGLELVGQAPPYIIISPHLDDSVLSLGGLMLQRPAIVLTVFGQSTWWRFETGAAETIQRIRQAEEDLAMRLCGAELRLLDLPDALLRGHAMEGAFSAEVGPRDEPMIERVRKAVRELAARMPEAKWHLPLGVGNHIDHRLTRDAAWSALQDAGVEPGLIAFYEDQPYAAEGKPRPTFSRPLREEAIDIQRGLSWKLELLRVYWSQLPWSRVAGIGQYARRIGSIERLWRTADLKGHLSV